MKFSIALNMERTDPSESMESVLEHTIEILKMAEEAGFVCAWAAEHHGIEFTIAPNPFLLLTHWAAHTTRIRLGTAVVVAPYWHPIRVAAETGLTDLYCGGRLDLGLGRGAFQYEFDRMTGGMPQGRGGAYLREMVPVLKKLWAGDYAHEGEIWQFPSATAVPKPVQKPHPPLWIAARDPNTLDFAVKQGCGIMTNPLSKPFPEAEVLRDKFETACANNPDRERPPWLMIRRTCVYDDERDLPEIAEAALEHSRRFEGLFSSTGNVANGFPEAVSAERGRAGNLTLDTVKEGFVCGTPEEVVAEIERYEALGLDFYTYIGNFGLSARARRRSMELFVSEVMPHFA